MAAALPHVDVFAAAHNLASLMQVANELGESGRGRTSLPTPPAQRTA
jgi:hypothetical protein